MYDVVVVSFYNNKTIDYLLHGDLDLKRGNLVVVDTDNGLQLAIVKKESYNEKKENLVLPLKSVLRLATAEDLLQEEDNKKNAEKALIDARKFSKDLNLQMNFIEACYSFDKSQLLFYFLADERVDFRELAKKLAQ